MCLILACLFSPSFKNDGDKSAFNSLLKKIFDFEPTSFIEELLTNILKEQINYDNLKTNSKQIQKVSDLI